MTAAPEPELPEDDPGCPVPPGYYQSYVLGGPDHVICKTLPWGINICAVLPVAEWDESRIAEYISDCLTQAHRVWPVLHPPIEAPDSTPLPLFGGDVA